MRTNLPLALLAVSLLSACGARLDGEAPSDAHALRAGRYQLVVQTESPTLDKFVYEVARKTLSPELPIAESGEFTGVIEVTFTSNRAQAPVSIGSGGYSGGHHSGVGVGLGVGGALSWQNSLMAVTVKGSDGALLWSATIRHRGNLSLGGVGDNAGVKAAQRCLDEVVRTLAGKQR